VTIEQVRTTLATRPFQPFMVRMADGRQFPIPHPDFLSMSPAGRTAVIFNPDGSASIGDLLLLTELELSPPPRSAA